MNEGPYRNVNVATAAGQPSVQPDTILLDAIRHGDDLAFEALFERYYSKVYSVAYRVLGSPEDAEELALDVFMKLHQRPLDDVDDGALGGWLYRSTLNASFNALRSRRRRFQWLKRVAILQRSDPVGGDDPSAMIEKADDAQIVRNVLQRLPEKQRNALVLRSQGFQYREIAEVLEIAESSVGTTLARGERKLREHLESEVLA